MSDEIKIPKIEPISLVALLRQIKIEAVKELITDADRNKVFGGKTEADQLLLLGEVLDKKGIKYTK
jgi:hypothetical protein